MAGSQMIDKDIHLKCKPCIVLVTGASGFLGQHVVGLLQTHASHVTEIRVIDVVPYVKILDFEGHKPVTEFVGSIADLDLVMKACEGVSCVMHVASIVDARMFPDRKLLDEVNVKGTENLLKASKSLNVSRFIYCSSASVVMGYSDIIRVTEDSVSTPKAFINQDYAVTKHQAEQMVIAANGPLLSTVSIRPTLMYGEGDVHGPAFALKVASATKSYMKFYPNNCHFQEVYGGNVAWMFMCAEKTLIDSTFGGQKSHKDIGGHVFFACDDTPLSSVSDFLQPIYEACGFKPLPFKIPIIVLWYMTQFLFCVLFLVRLIYDINIGFCPQTVNTMLYSFSFRYDKATRCLGYTPLYNFEDSTKRSLKFYKQFRKYIK